MSTQHSQQRNTSQNQRGLTEAADNIHQRTMCSACCTAAGTKPWMAAAAEHYTAGCTYSITVTAALLCEKQTYKTRCRTRNAYAGCRTHGSAAVASQVRASGLAAMVVGPSPRHGASIHNAMCFCKVCFLQLFTPTSHSNAWYCCFLLSRPRAELAPDPAAAAADPAAAGCNFGGAGCRLRP